MWICCDWASEWPCVMGVTSVVDPLSICNVSGDSVDQDLILLASSKVGGVSHIYRA